MLKKTIAYEDYNGVSRKEDFYFNLTLAEMSELEMGTTGGFTGYINQIMQAQDTATLIRVFKELILKAYGQKSLDGRTFDKSEKLATDFSHTEAYSILFMELSTDAEAASKFVNGIIPAASAKKVAERSDLTSIAQDAAAKWNAKQE